MLHPSPLQKDARVAVLVAVRRRKHAETTFTLLAECLEILGAVPKVLLADRMGPSEGGWSRTGGAASAHRCSQATGFAGWARPRGPHETVSVPMELNTSAYSEVAAHPGQPPSSCSARSLAEAAHGTVVTRRVEQLYCV